MACDDFVLSDVHLELRDACTTAVHRTLFEYSCQLDASIDDAAPIDEDGDLLVRRRRMRTSSSSSSEEEQPSMHCFTITHHGATALCDVGLQIWRGGALLCDYLLQQAAIGGLLRVRTLLELGGGVGLASVAAASAICCLHEAEAAPGQAQGPCGPATQHATILCTDLHLPSLKLAEQNFRENFEGSSSSRSGTLQIHRRASATGCCARPSQSAAAAAAASLQKGWREEAPQHAPVVEVAIRTLDWSDFAACQTPQAASLAVQALLQPDADPQHTGPSHGDVAAEPFSWREGDLQLLRHLDIIMAGDVVFDETLTEAMLSTAAALLRYATDARAESGDAQRPPPKMVMALEKRWCFTLRDMDSRAPAFDHFCSLINVHRPGGSSACSARPTSPDAAPAEPKLLHGRRLDVGAIPQRLQGYERGPDLELWELSLQAPELPALGP